jgi:cell division protein ZapA (FtsZ GTPase activity inhibitor)
MSSDTDEAHLRGLAEVVNERIAALGDKARQKASPAQLLAVVALGLAEDLNEAGQRREQLEGRVREIVERAISRIDRRLEEDARAADDVGEEP